jgi:hypothetical protein
MEGGVGAGDEDVEPGEGEQGAHHGDPETAAETHHEKSCDVECMEKLNTLWGLEKSLLCRGKAHGLPTLPAEKRGARDPDFSGRLDLRETAFAANLLKIEDLGGLLATRGRGGLRGGERLCRMREHELRAGWGWRTQPCSCPTSGRASNPLSATQPAQPSIVEVRREAAKHKLQK